MAWRRLDGSDSMPVAGAGLTLDRVTRRYTDGAVALDDVSLDIGGGELVCGWGCPAAVKRPFCASLRALSPNLKAVCARTAQPSILLLGEPFAALDKHLRLDMQIEVKRLQRLSGITTILVMHDQGRCRCPTRLRCVKVPQPCDGGCILVVRCRGPGYAGGAPRSGAARTNPQ